MTATADAAPGRMLARVKQIWAELDYAQRRVLEIRTGIPLSAERHPGVRPLIEELEAAFADGTGNHRRSAE